MHEQNISWFMYRLQNNLFPLTYNPYLVKPDNNRAWAYLGEV